MASVNDLMVRMRLVVPEEGSPGPVLVSLRDETVVLILSGGMDSAVLMWWLKAHGAAVVAVSFNYGQRHSRELMHAGTLAERAGVAWHTIDMSSLGDHLGGSSQTDPDVPVPHGHYAAENMKTTVVPNRNAIMLSVAMGIAAARGARFVGYAAHGGDHAIYPDCRPEFVTAMQHLGAFTGADEPVEMIAPFVQLSKADLARIGYELGVPFALTYSCYEGEELHCGKCGTCVERSEAFSMAGLDDPTPYREES